MEIRRSIGGRQVRIALCRQCLVIVNTDSDRSEELQREGSRSFYGLSDEQIAALPQSLVDSAGLVRSLLPEGWTGLSERVFLETIRQWGKKVAMVVNKIDILRSEDEVAEVVDYVSSNASRLLGADPEVFPVSALRAAEAKDAEARAASGLPAVEAFGRW